ncbi:MAG: peptidoglycan-binding domain-containing protein [bacterium]|nr:peptidoglycan-binding domain-containing protein [bacterium]
MKTIYIKLILIMLFFMPILVWAQTSNTELSRPLRLGTQGEDVKTLQKFLAKYPEIYPEGLATGYFGLKTQIAVKKWQQKYGIEPVGIVGLKTIAKIKEISLAKQAEPASSKVAPPDPQNTTEKVVQPIIVNDTILPTATLNVKVPAPTKIYIETNPSEEVTAVYEYGLNINYGFTKELSTQYFSSLTGTYIENLTPSTTYQVRAKITDRAGNIGYSQNYTFTTPSTAQAPLLSAGPSVTSSKALPATSVAVSWETNIPCAGTLYYDTGATFGSSVRSDVTATNHNAVITGLSSGITYLYKFTCATTDKKFESDNYIFIATSSSSSLINNLSLASIIETLKGIVEKIITLAKE